MVTHLVRFSRFLRAILVAAVRATSGGGENQEQLKLGMAKCGTTEVCQIMPRYLKVHFSRWCF